MRIIRRSYQFKKGYWYQIIGKSGNDLPFPTQVFYVLSSLPESTLVEKRPIRVHLFVDLGGRKHETITSFSLSDLDTYFDVVELGENFYDVTRNIRATKDYRDIMRERPNE